MKMAAYFLKLIFLAISNDCGRRICLKGDRSLVNHFKFCCAQLNTQQLSVFGSVHRKHQNCNNVERDAKHGAGKPLSNDYIF